MANKVIGIRPGKSGACEKKKDNMMDYGKELQEILVLVENAKNRLGGLSVEMDAKDLDTGAIDEAMDALDDAIDILADESEK